MADLVIVVEEEEHVINTQAEGQERDDLGGGGVEVDPEPGGHSQSTDGRVGDEEDPDEGEEHIRLDTEPPLIPAGLGPGCVEDLQGGRGYYGIFYDFSGGFSCLSHCTEKWEISAPPRKWVSLDYSRPFSPLCTHKISATGRKNLWEYLIKRISRKFEILRVREKQKRPPIPWELFQEENLNLPVFYPKIQYV